MQIQTITRKRRASKTIAHGIPQAYSWGALSVTLEVAGDTEHNTVLVTLYKDELVAALAKITAREAEIIRISNNYKKETNS